MRVALFCVGVGAAMIAACGGDASDAPDAAQQRVGDASTEEDAGATPAWVSAVGYVMVEHHDYPELVHRQKAVACPQDGLSLCTSDSECGAGFACACAGLPGFGSVSRCVAAECMSDADCGGGKCLLSLGSLPDANCEYGNLGLFCSEDESPCGDNYACAGNGRACMYAAPTDRFECQDFGSSCP